MKPLHNCVALVTGGAHRLGRSIALALAQAGASLAIHYHQSGMEAKATVSAIAALEEKAITVQGNLAHVEHTKHIIDQTIGQLGHLDILVCSAGVWERTPIGTVTESAWNTLFDVNVRGTFFLIQHAIPYLQATKGCIITITDAMVSASWKNYTPYLASKAALTALTQNLACELAPNVRVNSVAPGPMLLPDYWNEQQRERAAQRTLLKRIGQPEDVAQAVCYLATADFVTGVVLPVDGGVRLG